MLDRAAFRPQSKTSRSCSATDEPSMLAYTVAELIVVHGLVHELLPAGAGHAPFGASAAYPDQAFQASPVQRPNYGSEG
jgi:hypothetical protein